MGQRKSDPIVLGRKFCLGCGRWRPIHDFPRIRNRLRGRCRACTNAYQRVWWRNMTPEQLADEQERHRFQEEKNRRRRELRNPRRASSTSSSTRRSVIDRPERVFLDVAPIVEAIEAYIARTRRNGVDLAWEELAIDAGVSPRGIYRLRSGESKHVRLDTADKLAVAISVPLSWLYPE